MRLKPKTKPSTKLKIATAALLFAPIAMQAQSSMPAPVYPVKMSANHRYLVDQKNRPFLISGDSPQGLIGRLTEAEIEMYFADREAHGFNTAGWVDTTCAGNDYKANKNSSTPDGLRPFDGYLAGGTDYLHYDLSKPNDAYFTRLDHIISIAAKHHILVFIDPMETIGWLGTLRNNGVDADYKYGQYLGERYKKFANVAWINGNDFNNWKHPEDDAVVLAVAKGIQSKDTIHIHTVEVNVFTSSSLDDSNWAPLISLNSTYTYSPTYLQMLHSYNQKPVIPNYLVEAHYDLEDVGEPSDFGTPNVLRREEYWAMLSGGTGQFYGNKYTWSFADGWQKNLDTPGVAQLKIWREFFETLPWWNLVPDQEHATLTAGMGSVGDFKTHVSKSDYVTASRTADGSVVVVYMPTERAVTVNLAKLKGSVKAQWFDPSNGSYASAADGPLTNSGSKQFTPPGKNHDGDGDWVLLLKAQK